MHPNAILSHRCPLLLNRTSDDQQSFSFYDRVRECLLLDAQNGGDLAPLLSLQHDEDEEDSCKIIRVEREGQDIKEETDVWRMMHLAVMIPIDFYGRIAPAQSFTNALAKAALMATFHFNNRLNAVVPNLNVLLQQCNVKMTLDFYDTKFSPIEAAKVLDQGVHTRPFPYETAAVVGASTSTISTTLAVLNSIRQIPQISYASTSAMLDNKDSFPLFGRVVCSTDGQAMATVDYLQTALNVTHFGIMYVRSPYGTSYRGTLQAEAARRGMSTVAYSCDETLTGEGMLDALMLLKDSGYRYFVAVIFDTALEQLLRGALAANVIGPGYFWMVSEYADSSALAMMSFPETSPLIDAAQGIAFISSSVNASSPSFSGFLREWDALDENEEFRDYFATKSPLFSDIHFSANYTSSISKGYTSHLYDSVMAIGLSACRANEEFFHGADLFANFLNLSFTGASDFLRINQTTGSRMHQTGRYVVRNVLAQEPNNGRVRFRTVKTDQYVLCPKNDHHPGLENHWVPINGSRFNYSDRTNTPPLPLPPLVIDLNLTPTLFFVGTTFASILIISSLGFGLWTWLHRNSNVVQRSQPLFLGILCFGVCLMASSIFAIVAQEPPLPLESMDFFCMAGYWTYIAGFGIIFSALVAKLLCINKVVQNHSVFQRVVVTPRDVVLPGVVIMSFNFLILLIWQVSAPAVYRREFEDMCFDRFGRPTSSIGFCAAPDGAVPNGVFKGLLSASCAVAMIYGIREAFKARHVNMDYRENVFIGYAMAIMLQTVLVFGPLIVIAKPGQEVHDLCRAIAVIATCATVLLLIFVPKINYYYQDLREEAKVENTQLAVIEEENEEENENPSGVRIVSVVSMVETTEPTEQRPSGGLRITRRQVNPRSAPRRKTDAEEQPKAKAKKTYDRPVDAPRMEMANFAMAL